MIRLFICFITTVILVSSCSEEKASINKFSDPNLVKIADLQDKRKTDSLITFLTNENSLYRKEAALAFGSIQDSSVVDMIAKLLTDSDTAVRKAAEFALGQT